MLPIQQELTHKLSESKRLEEIYLNNWKHYESKSALLQEQINSCKRLLAKKSSKSAMLHNTDSEAASITYALNTLSNETEKVVKILSTQSTLLKKCSTQLDANLEKSNKIGESLNDRVEALKLNELLIEKIVNDAEAYEHSFSDLLQTENSLLKDNCIVPSLFEEIKGFGDLESDEKRENAIIVTQSSVNKIESLKQAIKKLKKAVTRIGKVKKKTNNKTRSVIDQIMIKAISLNL